MTREEAVYTIYQVINSNIISEELEEDLTEIANRICRNDFDMCPPSDTSFQCEGCKYQRQE